MQSIITPKQSLTKTQQSLRVSVLFILRVSPKARALATICSLRPFFRTSSHHVHHMHQLRVAAFLWSYTLALGSCLIASKDKTITKATTSGSVITEPTTQASASSVSLRPFFALLATTCISSASQRLLFALFKRATARKATGSRFSILLQRAGVMHGTPNGNLFLLEKAKKFDSLIV